MKYFILFLFCLYSTFNIACSCEDPVYYCDYSKSVAAADKGVILIGEFLAVDTIDEYSWAYQFKVLDLVRGQIEVGGLLNNDSKYVNTDSTIWFRGGYGSLCYYSHLSEKIIISTISNSGGYNPYTCVPSVLNIDENDIIQGGPWEFDFRLSLDDLDDFINGTCVSGTDDVRKRLSEVVSIYPNPTTDDLVLERRKVISLGDFPDGIYFLSLELDGIYYSEKIVKKSE